ncbi:MAG: hypothetical protein JF606_29575, partial [Burkholderiales bacterium]|nr:hypothetical protein [Burkholderiales bacterium]
MHNALSPVSLPVELHSTDAAPMKWNADTISALAKRMVRADWWYGYSDDSAVRMAGATKVRAIYKDIGDLAQSDMDAAHELWAKHAPAEFAKPAALDEQAQHLDLLAAEVISEPEPEPEPEDPSAPWIECRRFHTVAGKDPATRSWLDRFETVVEIHALVAYAQVRMHIHGFHDEAAAHGLFEAHKFVVDLARFDAENDESTEPPLQYPDLLDD